MAKGTIRIVDPAAELETAIEIFAPRLSSLAGMRIGIIDNAKCNADKFLEATKALLTQNYKVESVEYYRKFSASVPTPPEVIARLAESCDAIVHGVAD